MAPAGFRSVPEGLVAARLAVDGLVDRAQAALGRASAAADDVLERSWRGAAATAFTDAWRQWQDAGVELVAALEAMAASLDAAAVSYAGAEAANAGGLLGMAS